MGTIIDLTDGQDHDVLHTTAADGLFGGTYLDGQPLETYLEPDEQPAYVLQNKKSGLEIDGQSSRTLKPEGDFQAFALVTDLRVLFVVGQAGGDESLSLALEDIVETTADSGIRTSTLTIETLEGEQWSFPCSDDPTAVATHIENSAQVWANAARLLDDVEAALGSAGDRLSQGELETAREGIDGLQETIETATTRIQEVGPAAHAQIADRAAELRSWLTALERQLIASDGARAHARAHEAWQASEYESAATSYDRAIKHYQTALDVEGSTPTSETLWSRLRAGAAERELLRVGPLVDADTARRRALALADPEDAAGEWERALDLYRDLLGLDWGKTEDGFVANHDLIREQTNDIADDAIGDHYEAGVEWLRSGDKLAVQDRQTQATQVYERATEQFQHAHNLATEIRPDRLSEVETAIAAAEDRLDGTRPTDTVPNDPIAFEPSEDTGDELPEDESPVEDGIEGLSFHDSMSTAAQRDDFSADPDKSPQFESSSSESTSVLDQIQAQKRASTDTTNDADAPEATDADTDTAAADIPLEELQERLEALDGETLRDLVARLWDANGWTTSVVDGAGDAVYDVVAMAEESNDRALLWVVESGAGPVDRTVLDQCEAATQNSSRTDEAVVVTTASTTPSAESAAEQSGVSIIGPAALARRLDAAGLAGTVPTR
ncbi:restriction endonuclease [Halovenus halobia]|uniref:restriction endonuclease n=1 Tax=Halovenus halobia TaxID=3396622 RepID=UPI003F54CE6C